jgi:hypothetical protein
MNEGDMIASRTFGKKLPMRGELLINAKDGREHTVKNFLERPINLRNFEWKASDAQFKVIQTFDFPDDFLTLPLYQEKFDGFYGLRADIKFRLQVNAQPFQAGRLMIVWIPYFNYKGDYGSHYLEGTKATMVAASGCPRVDLDISLSTEAELCIPYCSPHSHFNLATGEGSWGRLAILVYSTLNDLVSAGHVDCTAWINLENIDLAFPTGAPLITKQLVPSASGTVRADAQVGSEERKMEQHRSIAQDISTLSQFLKNIPSVPMLSEIIQPVTWACDGTAAFLKFFGYSKLQSTNVPEFVKPSATHFMANYDGVDMSHCLGLASDNAIELMPDMVGNDVDEMALHHSLATPCFFDSFKWQGSDVANKALYTQVINPAYFYQIETSTKTVIPTHLAYTSSPFQYWRGSMDITFKFVKTKFHSGRVRIYFQPGTVWTSTGNLRRDYNYSQVVDIRSQTDVVFRVPYVATHPWLTVGELATAEANNRFSTTGVVVIEVLNELVGNSSVSADIDVLMEVSAGPDFELAGPSNCQLIPFLVSTAPTPPPTTTTVASARPKRSILERIAQAQVGQAEPQEEQQADINKDQIGNSPETPQWINSLCTVGEKVTSIRQLIKRSHKVDHLKQTSAIAMVTVNPYVMVYGLSGATGAYASVHMGYLDYFAHIYTFYRGNVNTKLWFDQKSDALEVYYRINQDIDGLKPNTILDTTADVTAKNTCLTAQVIPQNLEGIVDLNVPFYSAFHMCPITNLQHGAVNDALGIFPKGLATIKGITSDRVTVFRNATDSFQFGFMVGPPRCVRYSQ